MKKYIMALDAGTTSNRAIIFDESSNIVSVAQKELKQYYPQPGWVEHDALEIWSDICFVMRKVLKESGLSASDIAAVGISNQRETAVVWNRQTGEPIYHAIVWQSRQTVSISDDLKKRGVADEIRHKTGLPVDAYFSGTKIAWILENVLHAREMAEKGDLLFGTVDTWLIWNLTAGKVHVTDYTNASRTMIYNIRDLAWDEALLGCLNIPRCMLPEVKPSACIYGTTNVLGTEIPVASALGDQQAALFGQNCFEPGMAKNTYGTGCFLLMNTGKTFVESRNGLVTTLVCGADGKVEYALEGSVFIAGAAVQWLRDEMRLITSSAESERVAKKVCDSGGVYFVPAFTGLGAPYWDENARGMMIGITRGTTREHMVRAVLESIAFQTKDMLDAVEADTGIALASLNVDGGAASNDLLMQFQADLLGGPITRSANLETTALGACHAAKLALLGKEEFTAALAHHKPGQKFVPKMEREKAEMLCKNWRKAVKHAQHWMSEEQGMEK